MKYFITGGTGFVGQNFIKSLDADQDHAIVLSRKNLSSNQLITYVNSIDDIAADEKIDVMVNLAGSKIDQRWTASVKKELTSSRIDTTRAVLALIEKLESKPSTLLSASAIGYYGDHSENEMKLDESSAPCASFTSTLCQEWEQLAAQAEQHGVRVCLMRFGVILGKGGGFIDKITLPYQLGLGGKLGSGKQSFPWIHMTDVVRGMHFLINHSDCRGSYNFTAPLIVNNQELTFALGKALKRPTIFSVPSFIIRAVFGEMGEELLLKGNAVYPEKLLKENYEFTFPKLADALDDIYHS